ncbi:unnamed protein product, partial [Adineta steineri]
ALNDSLTESYIKCFQDNRKLIKKFYTADSIINDTQRLLTLTTLCSGLENIQFNLKADCVYFDRSCWPAYLQVDIKDTEKLSLPGVRNDVPSFATYLSRYDVQHIPSSPTILHSATVTSKRVRVPKRTDHTSAASSVVNSFVSSDIHPTNLSRSSSVSFDNPSIDGLSLNDENQTTNSKPILIDTPLLIPTAITTELSSSLSELDPMLNGRVRTPSPIPSTMIDEQIMSIPTDDTTDNQPMTIENQPSTVIEESINISEHTENSVLSSASVDNDLNIEKKNDDLLQIVEEDVLDLPADANLQLQFLLEVYELENRENFIKLFPTTIGHNNGNTEVVYFLITSHNIYLLRQVNEVNDSYRIEKIESIPIEKIDYIEIGPNEQFFRIITVKHTKLRCLTTGCKELTNLTESYIKCFQDNRKLIKKFYTADSIINDTQRLLTLTTLCSGLENIQFNLKADCVYFDRSCWPAYLQVDIKDTEKLSLPGVRNDVPSFATYLSRYDVQHIPSSPTILHSATVTSKRVRVPKRTDHTSAASSVVNSFVSSDIHPTNLSRSSSVSFDNPSIDGLSLNDENQITNSKPILIDTPLLIPTAITTEISSSLSELDPMLNGRVRTPSPIPSTMIDEQIMTIPTDDTTDNQPMTIENQPSTVIEESITISEHTENSVLSSASIDNDLNIEKKNDDLLQIIEEDVLDLPADANLQLQFLLEVYELENRENFIKLFPTTIGHNNGNTEVVYFLITSHNIYLLRQVNEVNDSYRIEKIESIPIEKIDYIEIGPNEQFFRIITVKHTKLRCLTTGCKELTK